ncbi:MAG: phage tail protein [Lacrimispora sp.]|jgi:hypothetical protein|nr:phage tail protein [Lacrimispora sp.]
MLGGGNFKTQNKIFPGAYINFINHASTAVSFGDRGVVAIPMILSWGPEKEIFEVTAEEFQYNCKEIFGYPVEDAAMLPVRELFQNMKKGIFYRLNTGVHAFCDYGTARYSGKRGNNLMVVISKNVDDNSKYDVRILFAGKEIDVQTVSKTAELKDNSYVTFKKEVTLVENAGLAFAGGTDGSEITGEDYSEFLNAIESSSFQILCCPSQDDNVKALFAAFTKRMRDDVGVKFQTVFISIQRRIMKASYRWKMKPKRMRQVSSIGYQVLKQHVKLTKP